MSVIFLEDGEVSKYVEFQTIAIGDWFLYKGRIAQKVYIVGCGTNAVQQYRLDGKNKAGMGHEMVIQPADSLVQRLNINIHWSRV